MNQISSCIKHVSNYFNGPPLSSLPSELAGVVFSHVHPFDIHAWKMVNKKFHKLSIETIQALAEKYTIDKGYKDGYENIPEELQERLRNLRPSTPSSDPKDSILVFMQEERGRILYVGRELLCERTLTPNVGDIFIFQGLYKTGNLRAYEVSYQELPRAKELDPELVRKLNIFIRSAVVVMVVWVIYHIIYHKVSQWQN
jgi:hypothetical protein